MRVVALTLDASLQVALSMMHDWEILSVADADEAMGEAVAADVLLVGVGGTAEGLRIIEELQRKGVWVPPVVVGDEPAGTSPVPVLTRPVSLDELRDAITQASGKAVAQPAATEEQAAESKRVLRQAPEPPPEPSPRAVVEAPPVVVDQAVLAPETVEEAPDGNGRWPAPAPSEEEPDVEEEVEPAAYEPEPAPEPEPVVEPPPTPPPPPPAPAQAAPAARTEPATFVPAEYEDRSRKRLLRRRPSEPPEHAAPAAAAIPLGPSVTDKLAAAMRAVWDLESLLEELPMLGEVGTMAEALLGEVTGLFTPQTASVLVRTRDGYRPFASHGLSRVESDMVVPINHALLTEGLSRGNAVLIHPVSEYQGMVAGIGGARTNALIAAVASAGGEPVALIVVGRDDFTDFDLQLLDELASQAGAGLAVARFLSGYR